MGPDSGEGQLAGRGGQIRAELVDDEAVAGLHGRVQAVRRGLAVEEPASPVGQRVTQGEGVDWPIIGIRTEREHSGIRVTPDGQPRDTRDGRLQRRCRLVGVFGQPEVSVGTQVVEHGPAGRDRPRGSGARHGR